MKILLTSLVAISAALAAQAQSSFTVTLTGAAERPTPVTTSATGSGTLTLSGSSLSYNITYSGLSGTGLSGQHIHGDANTTAAAPVLFTLLGGVANSTSGTLAGTITGLTAGQITSLQSQLWYVNVHSGTFPGGEIRGQIVPVPEPGTLALVGLGGLGLFGALRRRA